MSRIGMQPVEVPSGVTIKNEGQKVSVKGTLGELSFTFEPEIGFSLDGTSAVLSRKNETKRAKSLHGLSRQLFNNMVLGVSKGFSKVLVINGVGYKAELKGAILLMNLGYSHPIEYMVPTGAKIEIEGSKLTVKGIDKCLVGQVAAEIRGLRPPEVYKGKGIKYETEHIRRKVGKSGV